MNAVLEVRAAEGGEDAKQLVSLQGSILIKLAERSGL